MPARRTVARALESVADFPSPTAGLEQYLTPPEVAASLCHRAAMSGDLRDRPVVDLGTGTGMLALGAAHHDPARVVGVDLDRRALETARENAARLGFAAVEWVLGDGTAPPIALEDATVIANPPFGAQTGNRGVDRRFLEAAARIGEVSHTIHNRGSASFVEALAASLGGTVTDAFATEIHIDRRFEFHTETRRSQGAEVFRIRWSG